MILIYLIISIVSICSSCQASLDPNFTSCSSLFANGIHPSILFKELAEVHLCKGKYVAISYSPFYKTPLYVAYSLNHKQALKQQGGRESFYLDPDLNSTLQAPVHSKAFGEDYNHGHLAPSYTLSWSLMGRHYTYGMTNIAPQSAKMNQGIWKDLESSENDWILNQTSRSLHFITGVSFLHPLSPFRLTDSIARPDYFFSMICDVVYHESAGFYARNENTSTLVSFVSIQAMHPILFPSFPLSFTWFDQDCRPEQVHPQYWW